MKIERARLLKPGIIVHCPADRGDKAYTGIVVSEDCAASPECVNIHGDKYIWIEVQGAGKKSVWPSNRLG